MSDDSPSASGATNVLLNQRALEAPYRREAIHIQGDENPGKALGFDDDGVLTAIPVGGAGVSVESFGAVGNDSTLNTTAIQSAIDSLAATGGVISFPCGIYRTGELTLPGSNITFRGEGCGISVLKWTTIGTDNTGLAITGSGFRAEDMTFAGPGAATSFLQGERLITAVGTNTTTRLSGLCFKNCRFTGVGSDALHCQFVNNIQIIDCTVDQCAYSGFALLSCDCGRIRGGIINMLTAAGSSGNAYGIIISHLATGFVGSGVPTDAQPFCNDWVIKDVTVLGPKIWQAIDAHGAFNVNVESCHIFAAKFGISLTSSSGAASNFAGYSNKAVNNTIDINNLDGTSSGVVGNTAIMIQGGSGSAHEGCVVSGNIIKGYGAGSTTPIRVGKYACGFVISGNVLEAWDGFGIFVEENSAGGIISGNIFRNCLTDESAQCINLQGVGIGCVVVSGNAHYPSTNNAAYGIVTNADVAAGTVMATGNDFTRCTTQHSLGVIDAVSSGPFLNVYGPGAVAKVSDSSASGSPKLALWQAGTERAFVQYLHGDATLLDSDLAIKLNPGNATAFRLDADGSGTFYGKLWAVGDFETTGGGFIRKSPDGTRYRIVVANGGALSTTPA